MVKNIIIIIVRGIERQRIFSDDKDRDNFVERLGDIVTETETFCFAWALIRSAGGGSVIKTMRHAQDHMKSDERILGEKIAKAEQLELVED